MILGEIEINAAKETLRLSVANTGTRPIQIGSHFHIYEVNQALQFVREDTNGMRLNIPAGTAVRFEPRDEKEVKLVVLVGIREIYGFNALIERSIRRKKNRQKEKVKDRISPRVPATEIILNFSPSNK